MDSRQVQFKRWLCDVKLAQYSNNRPALQLVDAKNGDLVAVATVNFPDIHLEPNQVIIKNYSENEGIAEALMKSNIIGPPLTKILSGFVTVNIHELLI